MKYTSEEIKKKIIKISKTTRSIAICLLKLLSFYKAFIQCFECFSKDIKKYVYFKRAKEKREFKTTYCIRETFACLKMIRGDKIQNDDEIEKKNKPEYKRPEWMGKHEVPTVLDS